MEGVVVPSDLYNTLWCRDPQKFQKMQKFNLQEHWIFEMYHIVL